MQKITATALSDPLRLKS